MWNMCKPSRSSHSFRDFPKQSHPHRSSHQKVSLEIPQNLQENTYARVTFLIKLQAPWLGAIFSKFACNTLQRWTTTAEKLHFIITLMLQKQPPEVFCKKGVLRNFVKFKRKHLYQSLLWLWHMCFLVNFVNTSRGLLLMLNNGFCRAPLESCFCVLKIWVKF